MSDRLGRALQKTGGQMMNGLVPLFMRLEEEKKQKQQQDVLNQRYNEAIDWRNKQAFKANEENMYNRNIQGELTAMNMRNNRADNEYRKTTAANTVNYQNNTLAEMFRSHKANEALIQAGIDQRTRSSNLTSLGNMYGNYNEYTRNVMPGQTPQSFADYGGDALDMILGTDEALKGLSDEDLFKLIGVDPTGGGGGVNTGGGKDQEAEYIKQMLMKDKSQGVTADTPIFTNQAKQRRDAYTGQMVDYNGISINPETISILIQRLMADKQGPDYGSLWPNRAAGARFNYSSGSNQGQRKR